ncbi:MAG: tpx [Ilumatobacteraceae bacterium]|nr:tpx [Ilumatobacteraceae bacterium]MCU1387417.1 tpx [Ilumatobacteraceae bacterium]
MAEVTLGGNPVHTVGELPEIGTKAPDFSLTGADLGEITRDSFTGQRLVLNIFPSVDTPTCAQSVRHFNESASSLDNTVVLCVSADLPFAQGRFCGSEGLTNVKTGSSFRSNFGQAYGITLADSKLSGLLGRAVIVLDETGTVVHTELVPEIAHEPNYDTALSALA